jgi:hypothetical protein
MSDGLHPDDNYSYFLLTTSYDCLTGNQIQTKRAASTLPVLHQPYSTIFR